MKTSSVCRSIENHVNAVSELTGDDDVSGGLRTEVSVTLTRRSVTVPCRHHDTLAARIFNYETCEICINRCNFLLSCEVN